SALRWPMASAASPARPATMKRPVRWWCIMSSPSHAATERRDDVAPDGCERRATARRACPAGEPALPNPPRMSGGLSFFTVCFPSMFSIVDPIGIVPVYLALVGTESRAEQKRTAVRAAITAAVVLTLFAATGTAVFHFFGITIPAFKVAGGILMF